MEKLSNKRLQKEKDAAEKVRVMRLVKSRIYASIALYDYVRSAKYDAAAASSLLCFILLLSGWGGLLCSAC